MLPDLVQTVSIWSNGLSTQFKNRFMVAAVPLLERKVKKGIVWNYFATSHEKGPMDEIGGALKRIVWNKVCQQKTIVTNAESFVNAASESNICIVNVSTSDLQNRAEAIDLTKNFESAPLVIGISSKHCMQFVDRKVKMEIISGNFQGSLTDFVTSNQIETSSHHLELGHWWQVTYDGELFPGQATEAKQNKCKVLVMPPAGKYWKWSKEKDEIYYQLSSFVRQVKAPTVANSRGHFKFGEN